MITKKEVLIMGYRKRYKTKGEYLEFNGFDADGNTFVIVGQNTFNIKDELKAEGCKYNADLGWHRETPVDNLPSGCQCVKVEFDSLYFWDEDFKDVLNKTKNIKGYIRGLYVNPDAKSTHVGEIGDRLRYMEATVKDIRECPQYAAHIYVFAVGDNLFTWFTSSVKNIKPGDFCLLSGTVKNHSSWSGEPATALSRCIIKEAAN